MSSTNGIAKQSGGTYAVGRPVIAGTAFGPGSDVRQSTSIEVSNSMREETNPLMERAFQMAHCAWLGSA